MSGFYIGMDTALGIILHEISQEISDFGVLLRAEFSKHKALFFNFASTCTALNIFMLRDYLDRIFSFGCSK